MEKILDLINVQNSYAARSMGYHWQTLQVNNCGSVSESASSSNEYFHITQSSCGDVDLYVRMAIIRYFIECQKKLYTAACSLDCHSTFKTRENKLLVCLFQILFRCLYRIQIIIVLVQTRWPEFLNTQHQNVSSFFWRY